MNFRVFISIFTNSNLNLMKIGRLFRVVVCLFVFGALFHLNLKAQAVVSIADGPWNNANTWLPHIIPDFSNSTSITVVNNVTVPSGYSVTVGATTINGTLVIAGSFTLSGLLTIA